MNKYALYLMSFCLFFSSIHPKAALDFGGKGKLLQKELLLTQQLASLSSNKQERAEAEAKIIALKKELFDYKLALIEKKQRYLKIIASILGGTAALGGGLYFGHKAYKGHKPKVSAATEGLQIKADKTSMGPSSLATEDLKLPETPTSTPTRSRTSSQQQDNAPPSGRSVADLLGSDSTETNLFAQAPTPQPWGLSIDEPIPAHDTTVEKELKTLTPAQLLRYNFWMPLKKKPSNEEELAKIKELKSAPLTTDSGKPAGGTSPHGGEHSPASPLLTPAPLRFQSESSLRETGMNTPSPLA